jgi:phage baseplate assembly protein W
VADDFLGIGWNFPVRADPPGGPIELARYEESIRQAIWIVLGTARGERVMRPDFGCGIHNYLFALNTPSTIGLIVHEVREALLLWEPRIEVRDVRVRAGETSEVLLISIDYLVRATNSRANLVYPFYLERRQP